MYFFKAIFFFFIFFNAYANYIFTEPEENYANDLAQFVRSLRSGEIDTKSSKRLLSNPQSAKLFFTYSSALKTFSLGKKHVCSPIFSTTDQATQFFYNQIKRSCPQQKQERAELRINKRKFLKLVRFILRSTKKLIKKKKYEEAYQRARKISELASKFTSRPTDKIAWKRLVSLGRDFLYEDQPKFALALFEAAFYLDSTPLKSDSIFNLLWVSIWNESFKEVDSVVKRFRIIENFKDHDSKLKFWVAFSYFKTGNKYMAIDLYKKVINNVPLSYYSVLSVKKLKQLGEPYTLPISPPHSPFNISDSALTLDLKNHFKRLSLWLEVGNPHLTSYEIDRTLNFPHSKSYTSRLITGEISKQEHEKQLTLMLAKYLDEKGQHLDNFKVIYKYLSKTNVVNRNLFNFLFPFTYHEKVLKYSKKIDPLLILSLIRQESAFNHMARSPVGARGLMQIMPNTGKQFWRRLKTRDLYKPNTNLKIGIKYLEHLKKRFDHNLIYTLSAYNAGPTNANRWKRKFKKDVHPLILIEAIPFKETKKYVQLIFRNFHFYNYILGKDSLAKSWKESFKIAHKKK